MNTQICLVTGANSGIGKEICAGLAKQGAHVIMVCRNAAKGQEARTAIQSISGTGRVDLFVADLSSQADVRRLAQELQAHYPKIHVFINNAGVVMSQKTLSVDGIEMTLATNYLGPLLLTHLLAETLAQSAPARVINISSAIHKWAKLDVTDLQYERRPYRTMRSYAQSKLLLNMMTFELACRFATKGITVNCVHPGAVNTKLGSNNAHNAVLRFMDKAIKFFFTSAQKSAAHIVRLALAPELSHTTGTYFVNGKPVRASRASYDPKTSEEALKIGEKLTNFS